MQPTKLFISHAWDDKEDFVEPLVAALQDAGFEVWYDKFEMNMGDSLRQKIDQGLKECDFGVVVLSRHFFAKKWPQAELDGLLALEEANRKLILPIWKDVGEAEVKEFSPTLAGRLGASTMGGIAEVVKSIRRAVEVAQREAELKGPQSHLDRLAALEKNALNAKKARALTQSVEGTRIAREEAEALVASLVPRIEALVEGSGQQFKLSMEGPSRTSVGVKGPYRLHVGLNYRNDCVNSAELGLLRLIATQATDPWSDDPSKFRILHRLELRPHLGANGTVSWKRENPDTEFSNDQLVDHFLETVVNQIEELHAKHSKKT
jgi:hypothetical protein